MSSQPVSSKTFLERARIEALRYGEDSWVFLRELVQNSRDAGATRIEVETFNQDGFEILRCRDDGVGMRQGDFEKYLLRLYASSKEEQQETIGFFGVGFWSILLFNPSMIRVDSQHDGVSKAFEIDCRDFKINQVSSHLQEPGTMVTLMRSGQEQIGEKVRERLEYYAHPIRGLTHSLTLKCNGAMLNRDFPLPEKLGRRFKTGHVDGVIGFGSKPSVKIYKGGILVRDLASLEEVIPTREVKLKAGLGLYPVVAMNIDDLQILMDRQKIFEDQRLHEAVEYCEKTLIQLHRKLISQMFPMNWRNNIWRLSSRLKLKHILSVAGLAILMSFAIWLMLKVDGKSGAISLGTTRGSSGVSGPLPTVDRVLDNWSGATIDENRSRKFFWDFEYQGPEYLLFSLATLDRYDSQKGFFPSEPNMNGPFPTQNNGVDRPVEVRLRVSKTDDFFVLPTAPGYVLKPDSLTLNGVVVPSWVNQHGEPVVHLTRPGELRYSLIGGYQPAVKSNVVDPGINWGEPWRSALAESASLSREDTVKKLSQLVRQEISYETNSAIARRFENESGDWPTRVERIGSGDCDIINGFLVLLLRSTGIESYLTVGLVGENGLASSDLHAWVRYYDRGWRLIDLTLVDQDGGPGPAMTVDSGTPQAPFTDFANSAASNQTVFEPSAPETSSRSIWWLALILILPLAFLFFRFKRKPAADGQDYMANLFLHYVAHAQGDPLGLRYRPVFSLIGRHRKLSLYEIEKLGANKPLLGGLRTSPLIKYLRKDAMVLDRDSGLVDALANLLPSVSWLEDAELILDQGELPLVFKEAESDIRCLDDGFRIYIRLGSTEIEEKVLRFKNADLGERHFIIGSDSELYRTALAHFKRHQELGIFDAVATIMEKSTFFMESRKAFLVDYANRMASS